MAYNMLQRGQWQTRDILNGQYQVMWQKGGCKVRETSLMLNVKWHGKEKDSGRPGEVFSMVDVGWCAKAEGVKVWQTRGGILNGWCWVMCQSRGCKGVADQRRHPWGDREESRSKLREVFSMLNIKWCVRAENSKDSGRWGQYVCCLRGIKRCFQT